jgi:glycosyltransferase involved in cell wall biosynthesis
MALNLNHQNIIYVSNSVIPSKKANSVNVMNMAFSLSKLRDVTLLAPLKTSNLFSVLSKYYRNYNYYGVKPSFRINYLLYPPRMMFFYEQQIKKYLIKNTDSLVYTRELHFAYIAESAKRDYLLEMHGPVTAAQIPIFSKLLVSKRCRGVIFITHALLKWYSDNIKVSKKYFVAPDGSKLSQVQFEKTSSSAVNIGYAGSLYSGRGINIVLELAKRLPEYNFHVYGGDRQQIATLKKNDSSDNIKFYGHVDPSVIPEYFQKMDILLAPYGKKIYTDKNRIKETSKWMSPIKIFEYMSYRKPILCSNIPVLHEVLTDQETTLFCDPEDINSWVESVEKIVSFPETGKILGDNAYHALRTKYTWDKRAENIMRSIEKY